MPIVEVLGLETIKPLNVKPLNLTHEVVFLQDATKDQSFSQSIRC